ncbi:MAG: multicopper oxidase domain-containing protein [Acidobacteria bacterium]|nr:multicopper oxidase domain-containing protein [Acidobacteriota bacterium]
MKMTVLKAEIDLSNRTDFASRHAVPRRSSSRDWILGAGIALTALLPSPAAAQGDCPAGPAFTPVNEITSRDGKLQAVIKVLGGDRTVPVSTKPYTLRYFEGYSVVNPTQRWPVSRAAGPGPTLRGEIGDVVEITLLNQVNTGQFFGTLDSGEQGVGCDQVTNASTNPVDKNWYPADDVFPNCFHGSSSANLHFHGTHVTPSTTGDNILIAVRPNDKVKEGDVGGWFQDVFQHCELGEQPKKWDDLPEGWRDYQERLLREYDATAPYTGPGRTPSGHGIPPPFRLWSLNEHAIDKGLWPQYYSGSYPYCFQLPRCPVDQPCPHPLEMGQAPGTHWYHSHKHGSTALNLFNGLGGAFIITDNSPAGYDGKLRAYYQNKLQEKVLVFQQITTVLNLESPASLPRQNFAPGPPKTLVNGQLVPTITMRPGEVQLWRMINATVQGTVNFTFTTAGINFRQTAQDGVQLHWVNFEAQNRAPLTSVSLAPANRVDLLVQAPSTAGCYTVKDLVNVAVTGDKIDPPMGFPSVESDYPALPKFLDDIDPSTIRLRREITYGSYQNPTPPNPPGGRTLLQFTIDGKKFEDHVVNQMMLLDSAEEWTVYNADNLAGIRHPFHIHVNPFQVVEVYDPAAKEQDRLRQFKERAVWWDTFPIPAPAVLSEKDCHSKWDKATGKCAGYFKMRTRFVDFTGQYVQHCHILPHEDRGMMQLLEVIDNKTELGHH